MANSMKFSQWIRNPYTGEEVEIIAATENSLQNKIDKQFTSWEKDQAEWEQQQYIEEQKKQVQQMDDENWRLIQNLRYNMLSKIVRWSSYRYYDELKWKYQYSDVVSPPTIKKIKKELKVPIKIGVWEYFSKKRKNRRVAAEKEAQEVFEKRKQEYDERTAEYEKKKAEHNAGIDKKYKAYASGNQQEVTDFFAWVIEQDCSYIDGYYIGAQPEKYLFYDVERKMLAVDLKLPNTKKIPDIESYEYVEKQDTVKTKKMTQSDFKSFYRHIICEIILRVICVIYESDEYQLIDTIIVNGYRVFLDRSRGKHINDCIISVEFSKKEYEDLYLRNADGEEVIRRVGKSVPTDFLVEPIHVKPIYDSGILNMFYVDKNAII